MTEVTNELIYEVLKKVQGDITGLKQEAGITNRRLGTIEQHLAAFHQTVSHHEYDIGDLRMRIERIERRLELTDS